MLNHVEVVSFLHYWLINNHFLKKSDALRVDSEALQSSGKRAEQRRADVNSPAVNFQIRLKAQITVQPMPNPYMKLGVRTIGVLFLFKPIH